MNTKNTTLVDEAVAAIRELPEEEQTILAQDILTTIDEGVLPPPRSPEEQAVIVERMSKPRTYVPREEIEALFRKYNRS